MTDNQSESTKLIDSWDSYWRGAESSGAFTSREAGHPLVHSFWSHYFSHVRDDWEGAPKIVDIASGNGAVVECAISTFADNAASFTCLDVSESAIGMIEKRFPLVHGIVANAADMPLETESFDVVTSQYGIEYAGLSAFAEATRLVAPSGELALLMHHRDGLIYAQCDSSFRAISKLQSSEFIAKCLAMFETGFDELKGGQKGPYTAAGRALAPAIQEVESIMSEFGNQVADSTVLKLYRDVREVHANMARYESSDVLSWLEKMQREVATYKARMESMCNVAIDVPQFKRLCESTTANHFEILRAEPLSQTDEEQPLAWALVAKKI